MKAEHRAKGYLQMTHDRCIYRKEHHRGQWVASASVVDDLKALATRPCDTAANIWLDAFANLTQVCHLTLLEADHHTGL